MNSVFTSVMHVYAFADTAQFFNKNHSTQPRVVAYTCLLRGLRRSKSPPADFIGPKWQFFKYMGIVAITSISHSLAHGVLVSTIAHGKVLDIPKDIISETTA